MIKRLFATLAITLLMMLLLMAGYLYLFSQTPYGAHTHEIHIPRGTPLSEIIQKLAAEHVIASAPLFRLYLIVQGVAHRVRAGDYTFTPKLTPKQVTTLLLRGDFKIYRLTIPEGWTLEKIADYLAERGLAERSAFLALCRDAHLITTLGLGVPTLEGFLFPSSYETYYPESPSALITMMVREFQKNYTAEMTERAKTLGLTQLEVVTLASIIEKETGRGDERPLISSVFHNRLARNMPLQSDPTVIYGLKDFDGNLTRHHLESDTPYNTYLTSGLPPGPIANPGQASLLAALYPAETDYLYFVSKNDGSHDFSKTMEEHQEKVYQYQIKGANNQNRPRPPTPPFGPVPNQ